MDFDIASLLIWFVVFVFSTTCHEAAHAAVAYWGGDPTAYEGGQMSLDPLPHMRREPMGMVIVPLISFVWMGWMMGWASAPLDPHWALRHPKRAALMSAAGPFANFLLAGIAFVAMIALVDAGVVELSARSISHIVVAPASAAPNSLASALALFLSVLLSLNVILGLFNLFPVPPLDGGGIIEGLFPDGLGARLREFRSSQYGIIGLLVVWYIFPKIAGPVLGLVIGLLFSLS